MGFGWGFQGLRTGVGFTDEGVETARTARKSGYFHGTKAQTPDELRIFL